jgi:hypothetical protein
MHHPGQSPYGPCCGWHSVYLPNSLPVTNSPAELEEVPQAAAEVPPLPHAVCLRDLAPAAPDAPPRLQPKVPIAYPVDCFLLFVLAWTVPREYANC